MKSLRDELAKRDHFESAEQEAMLSVLRTSDLLENRLARLLREYDLTPSQYNVLRILRGEGGPMPMLEIAGRMIQVAPAITRVVDQLVAGGWVEKSQCPEDRRVFHIGLRPPGTRLLKKLDKPIDQLHQTLMGSTNQSELRSLIRILAKIRGAID